MNISKVIVAFCSAFLLSISLSACGAPGARDGANEQVPVEEVSKSDSSQNDGSTSSQKDDSNSGGTDQKETSALEVAWQDGAPGSFGGTDSTAVIDDARIAQSSSGYYCLVLNVTYQNDSGSAANLINDIYCHIEAYQGGVQLDSTGVTSEPGVYDYSDAFTLVKNGGTISTELVWKLRDAAAPIELEIGKCADYKPAMTKTLNIIPAS